MRTLFYYGVCLVSALYTVVTVWDFFFFLSGNKHGLISCSKTSSEDAAFVLMVQNVVLTVAFIASHSFMASSLVKKLFQYFNVMPIYRAVYNLLAAVALQSLMNNWIKAPLSLTPVWLVTNPILTTSFQLLQLFGWLITLSIVYILDFPEFMGWKHVSYFSNKLGCPLQSKTTSACNFYQHCRHPVLFSGFLIMWPASVMSIDRFLLSSGLILFVIFLLYSDMQNCMCLKC